MRTTALSFFVGVCVCWVSATNAYAQPETRAADAPLIEAAPATDTVVAPPTVGATSEPGPSNVGLDTVTLKTGALYRGTLLEYVPGEKAFMLLHDGSKREFAASEIASVQSRGGSSPTAPAPPSPSADQPAQTAEPPAADTVLVAIRALPDQTIYGRYLDGSSMRQQLCMGSCETRLAKGEYALSLAQGNGAAIDVHEPIDLRVDTEIETSLELHRASRITGGIILGAGLTTGLALLISGLSNRNTVKRNEACEAVSGCKETVNDATRGRIVAGIVIGIAATVVGAILLLREDRASVTATPAAPTAEMVSDERSEAAAQVAFSGEASEEERPLFAIADAAADCLGEIPATAQLRLNKYGSPQSLSFLGDIDTKQRACLRRAFATLRFGQGEEREIVVDLQELIRKAKRASVRSYP